MKSGCHIVSADSHRLGVTGWSNEAGTFYAVETGMLSMHGPEVEKFSYTKGIPLNWQRGAAYLRYEKHDNYTLRPPELLSVFENGTAEFRGEPV
jgi:hypothetical protein